MIIRREQIQSLVNERVNRFLADLRTHYPARTTAKSDEDLLDLILLADDRAPRYGLEHPLGVLTLAECFVAWGPAFDDPHQTLWAAKILNNPLLDSQERMASLQQQLESERKKSAK